MKNYTHSASLLEKNQTNTSKNPKQKERVSFFPMRSKRTVEGPHPSPGYCQRWTFQAEVTGLPRHLSCPTGHSQHGVCSQGILLQSQNYFSLPRVRFHSTLDLLHLTSVCKCYRPFLLLRSGSFAFKISAL